MSAELAGDEAFKQTRTETLQKLKEVYPKKTEIEISHIWEDILSVLVEFQGALINLPIDRTRLPLPKSPVENPDAVKDAALDDLKKSHVQEDIMNRLEKEFPLDAITRQELWGDVIEFLIKWRLYTSSLGVNQRLTESGEISRKE
jgi:hypothetical protein